MPGQVRRIVHELGIQGGHPDSRNMGALLSKTSHQLPESESLESRHYGTGLYYRDVLLGHLRFPSAREKNKIVRVWS